MKALTESITPEDVRQSMQGIGWHIDVQRVLKARLPG